MTISFPIFFVAGITGNTGSATAGALLRSGYRVRSLVRSLDRAARWSDEGVELIEGDLHDPEALARALNGVEGAYLLCFPNAAPAEGYPEVKKLIESYVQAIKQSPPKRLVLLSSIGADRTERLGCITQPHLLESSLGDQDFPVAVIRASTFFSNNSYTLGQAAATGAISLVYGPIDKEFDYVSTNDIGDEAASLLIAGWEGKKIVELGRPYTGYAFGEVLSKVLGKEVSVSIIPREYWTPTFEAMGIPQGRTGAFEEMCDGFNNDWISFGKPGAERKFGQTTLLEFFEELHAQQ